MLLTEHFDMVNNDSEDDFHSGCQNVSHQQQDSTIIWTITLYKLEPEHVQKIKIHQLQELLV